MLLVRRCTPEIHTHAAQLSSRRFGPQPAAAHVASFICLRSPIPSHTITESLPPPHDLTAVPFAAPRLVGP